ncbi:MAG: type VII toxin-antitoxin system HepT family RNase toxin [Desulfosalsimonas sp.]
MVDKEVLLAKIGAAKKHLTRLQGLPVGSFRVFSEDLNTQDIALFNLQLAVQNCIDIASHIISTQGLPVAGSTNELFYCLEENGYIDRHLSEKMVKAVGLRNLIVHEYGKLDLERIYGILQDDIRDLDAFLKAVIQRFNL